MSEVPQQFAAPDTEGSKTAAPCTERISSPPTLRVGSVDGGLAGAYGYLGRGGALKGLQRFFKGCGNFVEAANGGNNVSPPSLRGSRTEVDSLAEKNAEELHAAVDHWELGKPGNVNGRKGKRPFPSQNGGEVLVSLGESGGVSSPESSHF